MGAVSATGPARVQIRSPDSPRGSWFSKFYRLSRWRSSRSSFGRVAPIHLAVVANTPGVKACSLRTVRSWIGTTSISRRFFVIAVQTASATCAGVTSPAIGLGFRPVTAHIPASLTNVGLITETNVAYDHPMYASRKANEGGEGVSSLKLLQKPSSGSRRKSDDPIKAESLLNLPSATVTEGDNVCGYAHRVLSSLIPIPRPNFPKRIR